MFKEFKEFAVKGNAFDLAVGVIIGAAFGGIVTSLVKDIIMPPISALTGGLDFSNKFIVLKAGKDGADDFHRFAHDDLAVAHSARGGQRCRAFAVGQQLEQTEDPGNARPEREGV